MGKTFAKGGDSKKAAGKARKDEAQARKEQEVQAQKDAEEAKLWKIGEKDTGKKESAAAKKAEAAAKKAERDAQLAAEVESTASAKKGNAKQAQKKTSAAQTPKKGLDLSQLDEPSNLADINARGIDNALDALTLTGSTAAADASKIDRHPERRFKAAYAKFEATRLPQLQTEHPGLRRGQKIELIRKEFAKHPDNPFNQAAGRFDSTGSELREIAKQERERIEGILR